MRCIDYHPEAVNSLTWSDVDACVRNWAEDAKEFGVAMPYKDQFKDADTNGDGKLIGQEWGAYVLLARAEMLL